MNKAWMAAVVSAGLVMVTHVPIALAQDADASQAKEPVKTFHVNSVTFLRGWGQTKARKDKPFNTMSIEHFNSWAYGENYILTEIYGTAEDAPAAYLGWFPRLSTAKTAGIDYGGFIKDIHLAAAYETVGTFNRVYNIGIGMDFNMPFLDSFGFNAYLRDRSDYDGKTSYVSVFWYKHFLKDFSFGGYVTHYGEEGGEDKEGGVNYASILTEPQLLWHYNTHIAVGLEYRYWHNNFGIKDSVVNRPQAMLKWTF